MADVNLGYLAATTLQKYKDTLTDNIFKKNVLLDHMKNNDGVEYHDGGRQLVVPLMYGVNSSVMAFNGTDNLNVDYQDGIDAATYDWKFYNVSVIITKEDELKNKGKSAVISLIKAKIMQAENSLMERLNTDLFNGAASDSKEITGIETAVDTGTYGGIAGATYSWWQAYEENTAATLTVAYIRTGMNTVNLGNGGKCSIMVTTQLLHEKYESLLSATLQYNTTSSKEMKRLGDAGFLALGFRGVPVVFDEAVTTGDWFFLNTENLKLHILKDANFEVIKKAEPSDQHVSVQHIMFGGNTGVNRRKSLGKLTAKTSS
jgi:hypothetical protein